MTSLPSDLLEAPTPGVSKPTRAGTDHSSSSPEFSQVYGHVVSSAESSAMDPNAKESLQNLSSDPLNGLATAGSDLLTAMEAQTMTQVGNNADMPSASLELPAQIGAPSDALSSDLAPGDAFEAVKESFHDLLGPDLASVSVGYAGADIQSDAENTDPKMTGQSETNDLLALSMMAAGQGVTGGPNAPSQPITSAKGLQSPAGLETMTGMSQAAIMEARAKAGDNLLIVASEPARVSQSDNSLEHRPPISAGFNPDASLANSPTKPFANVDQSLDLNQTSKQQQASEMATFVRVLKNQGGGEAKINLHPAELGRMSISVSTDANDTKVSFVVETAQARQVIEAAMPKLKELLEQSGLSLSDSDVTEHHHQAANEKTDDRARSRQSADLSEAQGEGGELTLSVALDTDRLLDAYA